MMTTATFKKRLEEVSLNESSELWGILDAFAPGMYYYDPCCGRNVVIPEFLERLPEFRKWAKSKGLRWFRTWEQLEEWLNS